MALTARPNPAEKDEIAEFQASGRTSGSLALAGVLMTLFSSAATAPAARGPTSLA